MYNAENWLLSGIELDFFNEASSACASNQAKGFFGDSSWNR